MNIFIITVVTLLLVNVFLFVAYLHRRKEYDRLLDEYSEATKKNRETENENLSLRVAKTEMLSRSAELRSMLLRKKSCRFVVVSDELTKFMAQEIDRLQNEGYQYDKEGSFPTVLCFSKRIESEKSQSAGEK